MQSDSFDARGRVCLIHISRNAAAVVRRNTTFEHGTAGPSGIDRGRVNVSGKNDVPCRPELSNRVSRVRIARATKLRTASHTPRVVTRGGSISRGRNYNACSADEKQAGAVCAPRDNALRMFPAFSHGNVDSRFSCYIDLTCLPRYARSAHKHAHTQFPCSIIIYG